MYQVTKIPGARCINSEENIEEPFASATCMLRISNCPRLVHSLSVPFAYSGSMLARHPIKKHKTVRRATTIFLKLCDALRAHRVLTTLPDVLLVRFS